MILKERDDIGADIERLQALLSHPGADERIRRAIDDQIRNIRAGAQGEADAAYEIKVHMGQSANWMVLHDLRIEHEGLVAQIDHLLMSRTLDFYLCESKRISNGVKINENGEFSTFINRIPKGLDSPIEQNIRHVKILDRALRAGRIELPKRLGMTMRPRFKSFVLISRGAIQRPKAKIAGLETVIKTENLVSSIVRDTEGGNPLDIAKAVSSTTLEALGRQLISLHQPISFNWEARFGLKSPSLPVSASAPAEPAKRARPSASPASAVTCKLCAATVSPGVAKFCRDNAEHFEGQIYCMSCQKQV